MHFLGMKWDNESKIPSINYRIAPNMGEEKSYSLSVGDYIKIDVLQKKFCIGFNDYNNQCRGKCRNNRLLTDHKLIQCFECNSKDSTQFLGLNALKFEQINELKKVKHFNYINVFGEGQLKTGVSADWRKNTRLLEQGAIGSLYFASGNGYISRKIEEHISLILSVKQAVSWESKIKDFNNILSESSAKLILFDLYEKIKTNINDEYKEYLLPSPEFKYNFNLYSLNNFKELELSEINYATSFEIGDVVQGEIISIYGEILILKVSRKIFAINLKGLLGFEVKISNIKDEQESQFSHKIMKLNQNLKAIDLFGF